MQSLSWGIEVVVPGLIIAVLAVIVPRLIYRLGGRSGPALMMNMLLSACVLTVLSAGVMAGLYVAQGWRGQGDAGALVPWFLQMGLQAGIVWTPIMLLAGMGLLRRADDERARAIVTKDMKGNSE